MSHTSVLKTRLIRSSIDDLFDPGLIRFDRVSTIGSVLKL